MSTPKKSAVREALKLVRDRILSEKGHTQQQKEFDIRRAAELMTEKKAK